MTTFELENCLNLMPDLNRNPEWMHGARLTLANILSSHVSLEAKFRAREKETTIENRLLLRAERAQFNRIFFSHNLYNFLVTFFIDRTISNTSKITPPESEENLLCNPLRARVRLQQHFKPKINSSWYLNLEFSHVNGSIIRLLWRFHSKRESVFGLAAVGFFFIQFFFSHFGHFYVVRIFIAIFFFPAYIRNQPMGNDSSDFKFIPIWNFQSR